MTPADPRERPERTFYGRRRGRGLRPAARQRLDHLLPQLALPRQAAAYGDDPGALWGRPGAPVWLEIGFGAGEHLAWQAACHRDVLFIGCEPFLNSVAAFLARLEQAGLANVRLFTDPVEELLDLLPAAAIARVFVLFPDPWPKARHHRRRLIRPDTLDALARIMGGGAELRLATDDPGLAEWMLFHTLRHGAFDWPVRAPTDWRLRPADQCATRYEGKAIAGRPVFLNFRRRS